MCVNELLCLYRAFCHFFFLVCYLVWLLLFLMEKHIKKQYKSTHACFYLCHTCYHKLYTREKLSWMSLIYERKIRKDFTDAVALTFISPKFNLDPFSSVTSHVFVNDWETVEREDVDFVACQVWSNRKRFRTSASGKSRGWLRKVVPIYVKIYRSALILQTYRTSVASKQTLASPEKNKKTKDKICFFALPTRTSGEPWELSERWKLLLCHKTVFSDQNRSVFRNHNLPVVIT